MKQSFIHSQNFEIANDDNALQQAKDKHIIHFLPCSITQTNAAPVDKFFTSLIKHDASNQKQQNDDLAVQLHGRRLYGQLVDIPNQQNLLVFKKHANQLQIQHSQNQIYYWKHDEYAREDDKKMQMLNLSKILDCLHEPIE